LSDSVRRTNNAEIQRNVAPKSVWREADLDVAGVHVGMEKTVAKHLRKKDGDPILCQLLDVDASLSELCHLADGHTVPCAPSPSLNGRAVIPQISGISHQLQALHIAPQLRGAGRLTHQVQFVMQVYLSNSATTSRGRNRFPSADRLLDPGGHHAHQAQVFLNGPSILGRSTLTATSRSHHCDRAALQNAPGQSTHWPPAGVQTIQKSHQVGLRKARSIVATATADGNGGTWSCRL
jgi:hypothetical protein